MLKKIGYSIVISLCISLVWVGCQSSDSKSDDDSQIQLFVEAPAEVHTLIVSVAAVEVSTGPLGNSFNVLDNQKTFTRSVPEDEAVTTVNIAIKPGTVVATVYAFPDANTNISNAIYYGKSENITVSEGEEADVTVAMQKFMHVTINELDITAADTGYNVSFKTEPTLDAGAEGTLLFNDVTPDFLNKAVSRNQQITASLSGDSHQISIESSTVIPHFAKVVIQYEKDNTVYFGQQFEHCDSGVCGSTPLSVYNYRLTLVDLADITKGIRVGWRSTTTSTSDTYFSGSFFDQIFLIKQTAKNYDLSLVGIYKLNEATSYEPPADFSSIDPYENPTDLNCTTHACVTINPDNSNAPLSAFDSLATIVTGQITQDTSRETGLQYPNTTVCSENLSQLGSDCNKIPKITKWSIENDQLILGVVNGLNSWLEFYDAETGTTGSSVSTVQVQTLGDSSEDIEEVVLDYYALGLDKTKSYFIHLKNETFNGSWIEFNFKDLDNITGIDEAIELTINDVRVEENADHTLYYKMELEAGKQYVFGIAAATYTSVADLYLVSKEKDKVLDSLAQQRLGFFLPDVVVDGDDIIQTAKGDKDPANGVPPEGNVVRQFSYTVPEELGSGTYFLKLVNHLEESPLTVFFAEK